MRITGPIYREDRRLHLFSREIAAQNYGGAAGAHFDIPGAILLTDIARNIRNIKKFREGKAYRKAEDWYYIAVKDLAKRHPYLTERTVRRTLARLRKAGVLLATKTLHRRKSEHTLWYSFADKELFKEALAQEDAISFWAQDAVEYGIEAAILLRNLIYVEEHGLSKDGWTAINPVEFIDNTDLPMSPQTVRRALSLLVKGGRLERRRNARYGNNYYKYRLVDSPHLQEYAERDALPTECYESQYMDALPTEYYENLPPVTAHRAAKDKENRLLQEFAEQVKKIKSSPKPTPRPKKKT